MMRMVLRDYSMRFPGRAPVGSVAQITEIAVVAQAKTRAAVDTSFVGFTRSNLLRVGGVHGIDT